MDIFTNIVFMPFDGAIEAKQSTGTDLKKEKQAPLLVLKMGDPMDQEFDATFTADEFEDFVIKCRYLLSTYPVLECLNSEPSTPK
jgi:hypothetical protein